jgi:hypothetical protein
MASIPRFPISSGNINTTMLVVGPKNPKSLIFELKKFRYFYSNFLATLLYSTQSPILRYLMLLDAALLDATLL